MILKSLYISFVSAVIIGCPAISIEAAPLSVTSRLDSVSILMGNVTQMNIQVVQDENVKGDFPLLKMATERGRATLLGDTIELGAPIKRDTTRLGSGRIQIDFTVPVQCFDSGTYVLPPIWYHAGKDSASTKPVNFRVVPVKALATDSISPFATVVPGRGSSIFDNIPDFIYYYWWILPVGLCVGFVVWWLIARRKKNRPLIPKPVRILSPSEEAYEALARLKARKLWEQGLEKEYFTELTEILRRYLVRRFGINAMEMTTNQILRALADSDERPNREFVRRVLDMADFVKFAKVRPLPADNIGAYNNVYDFISETKEPRNEKIAAQEIKIAADVPDNGKPGASRPSEEHNADRKNGKEVNR